MVWGREGRKGFENKESMLPVDKKKGAAPKDRARSVTYLRSAA